MDIRTAEPQDTDRIRRIAEQSFQTSYSLSPDQIETIVEGAFSDEALADRIESDSVFVITDEDELLGFADAMFEDHAILRWIHVEPGHRGQGAGTALFERVQTEAEDRDLALAGRVLTEDEEGGNFCEQFGFDRSGKIKLDFGDETFFGYALTESGAKRRTADEPIEVPETVTVDEKTLQVDSEDPTPGTDGPFFQTYEDPDGENYGYFCSNCGSTNVGSDSLGRLECQECGNKHLADQWDAAYF